MKKIALFSFLSLLFLASCRDNSNFDVGYAKESSPMDIAGVAGLTENVRFSPPAVEEQETTASEKMEAGNASVTSKVTGNAVPVTKIAEKIKKTADIDMTVEDYKTARTAIEKIVKSGKAYIGGEQEQNSTYSISNRMVIRVANKDFDGVVGNISAIASHVNSKNIYVEDVTAQFVDITARLKTKKEVEKRYLDLLQKAQKISDILEVEEQLRVIREEIEAKEGQLKYLNDQVDYSTINLTFHQDFEYMPQDEPGFFGRLGHAFGNGWKGFLSFLIGVVYAWPLWIILGLTTYFLVRFIRKRLNKK